jgi:hypothetical protein
MKKTQYLSNITSDINTSLNNKVDLSSSNVFFGTNNTFSHNVVVSGSLTVGGINVLSQLISAPSLTLNNDFVGSTNTFHNNVEILGNLKLGYIADVELSLDKKAELYQSNIFTGTTNYFNNNIEILGNLKLGTISDVKTTLDSLQTQITNLSLNQTPLFTINIGVSAGNVYTITHNLNISQVKYSIYYLGSSENYDVTNAYFNGIELSGHMISYPNNNSLILA